MAVYLLLIIGMARISKHLPLNMWAIHVCNKYSQLFCPLIRSHQALLVLTSTRSTALYDALNVLMYCTTRINCMQVYMYPVIVPT